MIEIHGAGRKNILVFIHGFLGSKHSFCDNNGKWLHELALKTPALTEQYDHAFFTYETRLAGPTGIRRIAHSILGSTKTLKKNLDLETLGRHLLDEVHLRCADYDCIILVCHSMGGLVAKSFLTQAPTEVLHRVAYYITLATPHCGIPSLALPKMSSILRNPQIGDLTAYGHALEKINAGWERIQDAISCAYLYGLHDDVVPSHLAIPRSEKLSCFSVDHDHFSITRPKRTDSDVALLLSNCLKVAASTPRWSRVTKIKLNSIVDDLWAAERVTTGQRKEFSPPIICTFSGTGPSWDTVSQALDRKSGLRGRVPVLVATDTLIDESEQIVLYGHANSGGVPLILWDIRTLDRLLDKHPHIAVRYGLVDRVPDDLDLSQSPGTCAISMIAEHGLVDRVGETEFIKNFFDSPTESVLLLTGMPGVGKSVLAAHSFYSMRSELAGFGAFRFSLDSSSTDFVQFLNNLFVKAGIDSFDRLCGNSHFSDDDRIEKISQILLNHAFLIVLDNFEDALDAEKRIRKSIVLQFLKAICALRCHSKIIITSRIAPKVWSKQRALVSELVIMPLEKEIVRDYCSAVLPRIQNEMEGSDDASVLLTQFHAMTGGVPLLMNLLDRYAAVYSLDHAYQASFDRFRDVLVNGLLSKAQRQTKWLLGLIAQAENGVSYSFFFANQVSLEAVNTLLSTGLVSHNVKELTYVMHPAIQTIVAESLTEEVRLSNYRVLATYHCTQYPERHIDDRLRHFSERSRVRHLIKARSYDEAAECLSRIVSRFLSFNSIDELCEMLKEVAGNTKTPESEVWLLNARAHIEDFRKSYNLSTRMYKEMYDRACGLERGELFFLATNNFGTTFRRRGNFIEASRYYLRAYRGARKHDLLKLEGTVLNNLGQNFRYRKEYRSAIRALERSIQVRRSERDDFRLAATLSHFGACCLDLFEYGGDAGEIVGRRGAIHADFWADRAYVNLTKSVGLQKDQGNYWLLDRTYKELGRYWKCKGDMGTSEKYKQLATDVCRVKDVLGDPEYY